MSYASASTENLTSTDASSNAEVTSHGNPDQPMIGSHVSVSELAAAYQGNPLPGFLSGIDYLNNKYKSMRKVKGDGNCFYRAFAFAYLEQLHRSYCSVDSQDPAINLAIGELNRFKERIVQSKDDLVSIGYEEFTFESFYDTLIDLLDGLFKLTADDLLAKFQADGESDYYTWFMRLITALSLRTNADKYIPFILDTACPDIDSFCRQEVEPMGRECDQMQIIAIAEYLGVGIDIEYLDGRPFESTLSVVHCGPEDMAKSWCSISLLYRPGHYDILYK